MTRPAKRVRHSHPSTAGVIAVMLASFLFAPRAQAARLTYYGVLAGSQEVPANGSGAFGGGRFEIDTDHNTVTYEIAFSGLSGPETAAHIHGMADPGTNGGVLTALPAGNPKIGVWTYAEGQEADLLAGRTYVNVHSTTSPGGEIRGQIVPLNASIDGAQEVPPTGSPALGFGVFTIDTVTNQLNYYIAFSGLSAAETAAHIHGPAMPGSNGGVAFALPAGSPKIGTWNYADAQEPAILSGRMYVNVHSGSFPGGEIRGQIIPIVVPMDGAQEVPTNGSSGAGVGLISYDPAALTLGYDIRIGGLAGTETAAHIHGFTPPGFNAGVLTPLPLGNRKLGTWTYTAADQWDLYNGLAYANVHSTSFAGGEIRGQLEGFRIFDVTSVPASSPASGATLTSVSPLPGSGAFEWSLPAGADARLELYDIQGRLVRSLAEGPQTAGSHVSRWDGRDAEGRPAPAGVYFAVLSSGQGNVTRKVAVVR